MKTDQPKPTGEWTAKQSQTHGWYIEFDRGNGASIDNELTAKGIVNAHNAALASVLEEYNDEVRAAHVIQKQLAAEREKVQTLVDALKEMVRVYGRGYEQGATVKSAQAVLAKVKQ